MFGRSVQCAGALQNRGGFPWATPERRRVAGRRGRGLSAWTTHIGCEGQGSEVNGPDQRAGLSNALGAPAVVEGGEIHKLQGGGQSPPGSADPRDPSNAKFRTLNHQNHQAQTGRQNVSKTSGNRG